MSGGRKKKWVWCGGGACTSGKMHLVPKGKALVPGIVGGVSDGVGEGGGSWGGRCMHGGARLLRLRVHS